MDEFSAFLSYLMVALYGTLSAYIALAAWRTKQGHRQVRLIWILTLPVVVFVAYWLSGNWVWTIAYFLWVLGAANTLDQVAAWTATIFAFVMPTLVFARLAGGKANSHYCIVVLSGSVILLILYGTRWMYESLR
jgi:hypothetical protein